MIFHTKHTQHSAIITSHATMHEYNQSKTLVARHPTVTAHHIYPRDIQQISPATSRLGRNRSYGAPSSLLPQKAVAEHPPALPQGPDSAKQQSTRSSSA